MKTNKEEKTYIYCYQCGTKNNAKAKKCVNCNTLLRKKEWKFLKWFFGEEVDNFKGNFLDYLYNCTKEFIMRHLYGTVVGIAFTFTTISGIFLLNYSLEEKKITTTDKDYRISIEKEEEILKVEKEEPQTPVETQKQQEKKTSSSSSTKKYHCPDGYELEGKNCYQYESIAATVEYECENGYYPTIDGICASNEKTEITVINRCYTQEEYIKRNPNDDVSRKELASFTSTGPYQEENGLSYYCNYEYTFTNSQKVTAKGDAVTEYSCPTGLVNFSNSVCRRTKENIGFHYRCSWLYPILDGNKCKKEIAKIDATYS